MLYHCKFYHCQGRASINCYKRKEMHDNLTLTFDWKKNFEQCVYTLTCEYNCRGKFYYEVTNREWAVVANFFLIPLWKIISGLLGLCLQAAILNYDYT